MEKNLRQSVFICGKKNLESGGWRPAAGFTLIEALIAVGVLGMGLILIAVVFPVGIKLTAMATERSIGTLAANEGVAKVQLWGIRPFDKWTKSDPLDAPHLNCFNYRNVINLADAAVPPNYTDVPENWPEFLYPSADMDEPHRYHWSTLCRRVSAISNQVQVTAFATRKVDEAAQYYTPTGGQNGSWPQPVKVDVKFTAGKPKELEIVTGVNDKWAPNEIFKFFDNNSTVIDDSTGRIYRVQEYKDGNNDGSKDTLVLTDDWQGGASGVVWVIPPAVGSSRNPVVGLMQTTMVLP